MLNRFFERHKFCLILVGCGSIAVPATAVLPDRSTLSATLIQMEEALGDQRVGRLESAATDLLYEQFLVQHECLRVFGNAAGCLPSAGDDGAGFSEVLLGNTAWMMELLTSGPIGEHPERVFALLQRLWQADPGMQERPADRDLATAMALEFGRKDWPEERALERYAFYRDSWNNRQLHPVYGDLQTWEKRFLAGYPIQRHGTAASQEWLRDNVKLPVQQYRKACWQVAYRGHNLFGDSVQSWMYYFPFEGSFDSFSQMTRFVGGVCGRLSGYGAGAAVANGIPASTMGEPGHCAYTVRVDRGDWAPAYSLSWKRSLHQHFYGSSWTTLLLTDHLLSNREVAQKAHRHLWQAHLHQDRDPASTRASYLLAVRALPQFLPAWEGYATWLTKQPGTSPKDVLTFHDTVLKSFSAYPETAWNLVSRHAYPVLVKPRSPRERVDLFTRFHTQLSTWGPVRWNLEDAINKQAKYLDGDGKSELFFAHELVRIHADSEDFSAPALSWGMQRFEKNPEQRATYLRLVAAALQRGNEDVQKDAVLGMCSRAVLAAEKAGDADTFNHLALLLREVMEPGPAAKPAFPGELVSAGGLIRLSSVSSRYDKPYNHILVPSLRPGSFHTNEEENPWAEVQLPGFAELSGIEIVNRDSHRERAVPLVIEVSVDGESWNEVAVFDRPEASWRIDLKGKRIRARQIRLTRRGKSYLHLQNIRVYGRRLS